MTLIPLSDLHQPQPLSRRQLEFERRFLRWNWSVGCQQHPVPAIIHATYLLLEEGWQIVRRELVEEFFRHRNVPVLRIEKVHDDAPYYFRVTSELEPDLWNAYPRNPLRSGKGDDPNFSDTYAPDLSRLGFDGYIPLGRHGWRVSRMPHTTLFAEIRRKLGESHEVFGGVKTTTGEFDFENQGGRIFRVVSEVILKTKATLTQATPPPHWRNARAVFYEARLGGVTYLQGGETEAEAVARLWLNMQGR